MANYARIQGGRVAEMGQFEVSPSTLFHPDLVWVAVPAGQSVAVGWFYTGDVFAPPPPVVQPVVTVIPSISFIQRFTAAEEAAISAGALTTPAVLMWSLRMAAAGSVDLTAPDTLLGMQLLVQAGLITQARMTAILTP